MFKSLGRFLNVGNVRFAHIPSTQQSPSGCKHYSLRKTKQILFTFSVFSDFLSYITITKRLTVFFWLLSWSGSVITIWNAADWHYLTFLYTVVVESLPSGEYVMCNIWSHWIYVASVTFKCAIAASFLRNKNYTIKKKITNKTRNPSFKFYFCLNKFEVFYTFMYLFGLLVK